MKAGDPVEFLKKRNVPTQLFINQLLGLTISLLVIVTVLHPSHYKAIILTLLLALLFVGHMKLKREQPSKQHLKDSRITTLLIGTTTPIAIIYTFLAV